MTSKMVTIVSSACLWAASSGADDYTQFLFYGITLVIAVAGSRYLRGR